MEELLFHLLIFAIGAVAGFVNTAAAGGSLLTLPVLILSGLPSDLANGTNRVAILLQNVVGVRGFKHHGVWNPRRSLLFGVLALIGAIPGAMVAVEISDEWFDRVLAVVVVVMGGYLLLQGKKGRRGLSAPPSWKRVRLSAPLFLLIGFYGGFIQAGVGFLILATLTGLAGFDLARANAVKVFVILVYTTAALFIFLWNDSVDWVKGLVLAGGNMIGAWVASHWVSQVNLLYVRLLIVAMAVFMGVKLWVKG